MKIRRSKKMVRRWIILVVIVVIAIILSLVLRKNKSNDLFATTLSGPFNVTITATGELQALKSEQVNAPSQQLRSQNVRIGEITIKDLVPEGTLVDSGQYVATLDKDVLSTQLKNIRDEVERREQNLMKVQLDTTLTMRDLRSNLVNLGYTLEERELVLEQSKYEPPATIRQAELNVQQTRRALQQAKENYRIKLRQAKASMREATLDLQRFERQRDELLSLLDKFIITAPKRGMIIYNKGWSGEKRKVGSTVSVWDPVVAELPDLSVMISKTYVNEVDVARVRVGQPVSVTVDAFPDRHFKAEVTEVANMGESISGSDAKMFEAVIRLLQNDSIMRPGMTTSNEILVTHLDSAIYCPLECVHSNDSITYVYTAAGKRQEVKVGPTNESFAVILAGLEPGVKLYLSLPEDPKRFGLKRLDSSDAN